MYLSNEHWNEMDYDILITKIELAVESMVERNDMRLYLRYDEHFLKILDHLRVESERPGQVLFLWLKQMIFFFF